MRIMGAGKLDTFLKRADAATAAVAAAWRSEVAAGRWRSSLELAARYPTAEHIPPDYVRFWLDDQHCALVRVNYDIGLVLIKSLGLRKGSHSNRRGVPGIRTP
jgi:hypothetical protein